MKKILGLDLGTTSIGWAYVHEAETEGEKSSIQKLGVRVIPISTDEETDFQKGKSISINAERTLMRGMRRNLQRYKQRRAALIEILKKNRLINDNTILAETGNYSTYETYRLRAKAAKEKVEKEDLAKILQMINKKRGYKSSRKANKEEEGNLIDGMSVAKQLYEGNLTPGQYVYNLLKEGKRYIPDFYRSDLVNEFEKIWNFQKQFYPDILTDDFKKQLEGKGKQATSKTFLGKYKIFTAENKGKRDEIKLKAYKWRNNAIGKQLSIEEVAYVITEINNNLKNSSGYLGAISDRSKELYFNNETVGQNQYRQLTRNPHVPLKNQVFYRQDYMDEFEKIWEIQAGYHPELTLELKSQIRDVIIFFQRRLKSQKHLISECEFEKHHKTIPKSSLLFQEFKIWQILNNLELKNFETRERFVPNQEQKEQLFKELNLKDSLKKDQVLKLLTGNSKNYGLNYQEVEGNRTNVALFAAYQQILDLEGYEMDFAKMEASEILDAVNSVFNDIGINTKILNFDSSMEGSGLSEQSAYQLWHLLYSFEDDNSEYGNEKLLIKLQEKFGFKPEHARLIVNIPLQSDYGSLSARAIRKILPHLKDGNTYDVACAKAGYKHSSSKTAEEQASRILKDKLDILPKNSFRNPVVEKILNQMVNLINAVIEDKDLGKPDEIRIELARELKKSAQEREDMTKSINAAKTDHEKISKLLQDEFGIKKVTRNDIIRYKLYRELETVGYKTIYTGTYIPREKLFSKEFDIEHIIPQARLFDDSFSNKTLSSKQINIEKSNETAYDYLKEKLSEKYFNHYLSRIEELIKKGKISRAKYNKLLMKGSEIPDGFIDRDLRDSQYIAKKAKQLLEEVVRDVTTTTGSITDRLRQDWQLVDVMKELNLPKYRELGLTETIEGKNGKMEERIKDWSKRNDHRHHAMDALTVAFTKRSHVQYLNNLNARSDKSSSIYGIEQKNLYRDGNGKLKFKPPIPLADFRSETKKHLESLLVSYKAKNKVVTRNINKTKRKVKNSFNEQVSMTPRGQLHKETIYGRIRQYITSEEKVGTKFNLDTIQKVAVKKYRDALLRRLVENDSSPKKAFGGKNSPSKNPVYIDDLQTKQVPEKVKLVWLEDIYTIRKDITPDLKVDKVIDKGIQNILQKRLEEYDNDTKKAFSNLDQEPIWLNEEKGISIKRVTISGIVNAEPLHDKKDHLGNPILDEHGNPMPIDFVSTGNNHHVAIFRDENGNLQDEVVTFFEAVRRVNMGLPIINKHHQQGWEFLFTMKQNEYFIFPSDDFDPNEIDLLDVENAASISRHLYRLQKLSKVEYVKSAVRDYVFRHHLETQIIDKNETKGSTYITLKSLPLLGKIIKVRLNHLGHIVKVGE